VIFAAIAPFLFLALAAIARELIAPMTKNSSSKISHQFGVRLPAQMRRVIETIAERDASSVAATIRRLVAAGLRHERGEITSEPNA
jgi:hypothetical protein